ncbi:MAG TPA: DUF2637 domain-containing protein [Nonomuraea sp.]|nr:DUF2637 domain-containing protein [Nonomuraea sp.]
MTPPPLLRRLGLALAGLAVAALAGAACALSFDDLRALAVTGEARPDLAYLYPAAFDALLVVALLGVLLLRPARPLVRVQAAIVLVLLIAAAAAVNVATAMRFAFDVRQASVGVALAPWIMLAVALWLWLLLLKHAQARRAAYGEPDASTPEPDLVPFHRARPAETTPAPPAEEPSGRPTWEPTRERAEQRAEGRAEEAEEMAEKAEGKAHEEAPEPPAHEDFHDRLRPQDTQAADDSPAIQDTPHREPPAQATRPLRWGDRVKPTDVLVHPRPGTGDTGDTDGSANADDRDADTQPHPVFDDDVPDPLHGPEAADLAERHAADDHATDDHGTDNAAVHDHTDDELADTAPHPVIHDDTPAPSGRLRSTPRPPDD